jgi:hypothetical protein
MLSKYDINLLGYWNYSMIPGIICFITSFKFLPDFKL